MSDTSTGAPGNGGAPNDELRLRQAQALTDVVVDALAAVTRDYGEYGFDIDTMSAAELSNRCGAWSEHILLGKPAPYDAEDTQPPRVPGSAPLSERRWKDLRQFIRTHRRDEQAAVTVTTQGMRGLVGELIDGLRRAFRDDMAKDALVAEAMTALTAAVERDSLSDIRLQMSKTLELVSGTIHDRRRRYEAELAAVGQQMQGLESDLEAARNKAEIDALTQVYNRGAFDDMLVRQMEVSFITGQPIVLLMVDLDHFKRVNDTYGHPGGDAVLKAAADVLVRAYPRRNDFVARYGGEEFVVLLADVDPRSVGMLGGRALKGLRGLTIQHEGQTIQVTASVGAAAWERTDTAEAIIRRADTALYEAKENGRNRMVVAKS